VRADPKAALLAASLLTPAGHRLPRCHRTGVPARAPRCIGKGAGGQPAGRLCAAEERRARDPRAQRAS